MGTEQQEANMAPGVEAGIASQEACECRCPAATDAHGMRRSLASVLWFFVFAYAITGAGMCVNFYALRPHPGATEINSQTMPWLPYAPYVLWVGPCFSALLMTILLYGLPGVRRLVLRLAPWSVGGAWLVPAVCLVLPLGAVVLPVKILAALGFAVPALQREGWSDYLYTAAIGGGFLGPGLFEEIGWRGFALPQLQRRYSALVSSLILGLVWSFWHFPNFPTFTRARLAIFVPMGMVVSVSFTSVYNSTGGNLFAVVLLHGAFYAGLRLCEASDHGVAQREDAVFALIVAAIAVGLVWRYGAANLSWRDRVVAGPPEPPVASAIPPKDRCS